jgi:arylsulfatase A-like enzyme
MLRRQFLRSTLAAAGPALLPAASSPPNLVFLLCDDLGYGDIGCYGAPDIRTPHIDRMARNGVRFADCYANAPVCTPTRVGFLSGRYQQRFGKDLEWAFGPANNKTAGLRPADSVLPSSLKPAGYRSAAFGKWHVGWSPEFRPIRHGFDESFGILLGNASMYTHKYHDGTDDLWENDLPVKRDGYLTDLLADRAVNFIEKNAQRPFFLYLPFNAVHWPFEPPGHPESARRTAEGWRDGKRSEYVAMMESVDQAVGRVLQTLQRTGNERNTLVVFTSDNGGERLSNSDPFFNVKGSVYEGGIRVPAIAQWPGVIPSGRTTHQMAITMDFTATFLKAAGVTPANGARLDGEDLLPVMTGRRAEFERTFFWRVDQPGRRQLAVRRGKWKYIDDNTMERQFPELLYDLSARPYEHKNVYYDHQELAAELRKAGREWERDIAPKQ